MSAYISAYDGYMADVPVVWFKRNDGKIYCFDKISDFTQNPTQQKTEISAGWAISPVAYLPTGSSIEADMTTPEFSEDQFGILEGTESEHVGDAEEYVLEYIIKQTTILSAPYDEILLETVDLHGYRFVETDPQKGEFAITRKSDGSAELTIGVDQEELKTTALLRYAVVGKMILNKHPDRVDTTALYSKVNRNVKNVALKNYPCAVGECVIKYPVYSSSRDCTLAAIKGYVFIKLYKCRIANEPSSDSSYKGNTGFRLSIKSMNAKRDDKTQYVIAYYSI